jgi:cysteine synthase
MKFVESSLQLIGGTPLLKLRKVTSGLDSSVFVKCEFMNPSGSIKDRIALKMIEGAEQRGRLRPGGTIVDMSSGNGGPAIAFVGAVKGYKVRIQIPSTWTASYNPENRIKMMKIFGAQVSPIDLGQYKDLLSGLSEQQRAAAAYGLGMKACYELERDNPSFWWSDQMSNPDNVLAHKMGTGGEIIEQTDNKVSAFVASVGSGGTLLGVTQALREKPSSAGPTKIVGVEPEDALVIEEWAKSGFLNDFLSKLGVPKRKYIAEQIVEKGLPDEMIHIGHDEARAMANRLASEEGVFCGLSSGANVCAAIKVAKGLPKGANVVTVCVDSRDRYYPEYPNENYVI